VSYKEEIVANIISFVVAAFCYFCLFGAIYLISVEIWSWFQ